MKNGVCINPSPSRPADALVRQLSEQEVSHLSDSMGRAHTAAAALRPLHGGGTKLCGPAFTVWVPPGDHLMVQKALDLAARGDVIVVDAAGFLEAAMIGEIMTAYAAARGIAGFVIDGAIRDLADISRRSMPVYARGTTPRGPTRLGPGRINIPVCVGGMVVHPGDIIVGDADGVVCVPAAIAEQTLTLARSLRDKEKRTLQAIAEGTLDRSWIDEALHAQA